MHKISFIIWVQIRHTHEIAFKFNRLRNVAIKKASPKGFILGSFPSRICTLIIFLGLCGGLISALPYTTMGSGSYPGRPPILPSTIDTAKYHLGKHIFAGKARLGGMEQPPSQLNQEARLQELQTLLPKRTQKSVNLPALAGKLSADRMEALEYYLTVRYKIEIKR